MDALALTAVVGDQTWQTPGWPVAMAGGNALVAILLAVLLGFHARGGGLGRREAGVLVAAFTPFFAVLVCVLPFALVPGALFSSEKFPLEAFLVPLTAELIASGVAMCAAGIGVGVWCYAARGEAGAPEARKQAGAPEAQRKPSLPVVQLLLFPVVMAVALAGPAHVVVLDAAGPLPPLDLELGPRIHVGITTQARVLVNGGAVQGWYARPVLIQPQAAGEFAVELRAERAGLVGVRVVTREAGEDRGDPLLPLAQGNTWELQDHVSRKAQYMWFVDGDTTNPGRAVRLSVDANAETPLRTWRVILAEGSDEPQVWTVYNWNGAVLDTTNDQPFVRGGEPAGDGLTSCALTPFEGWECACGEPPPPPANLAKGWEKPWDLPGPARCYKQDHPGPVRAGFGALLALVTVGLVIDMGDQTHTLVLVRSGKM